jgi:hypothetical protein
VGSGPVTDPVTLPRDLVLELTGINLFGCPRCHNGTMIVVAELPSRSGSPQWDSS